MSSQGKPFYWTAPTCVRACDCAPTGWYQWTGDGLKYLGVSILGDPDDVCKCGALRKDHGLSENHAFMLDEFPSQPCSEDVSRGVDESTGSEGGWQKDSDMNLGEL